ncbi:hypothetical protein Zmor_000274 [Zophobas morio]|uniref:acid phosphatase n=1 Tax=Zophobas morio TaxID=2755281 RepID=A0AA38IZP9_9CUCU|nr:hypothetical protein Zmor_000274 [Zophobas morio]
MTKISIFLFALATTLPKLVSSDENTTLELVHVIFRHGNRAPQKNLLYPKDPHINASYHPADFGEHTNIGKLKQYRLGEALRQRYKTFLGPYSLETVDARSTDYARTKVSLQLVLASLFPPENEFVWNENLKWQPVAFNYWPIKNDHVLGQPYRNCPRYRKLYLDFLNSTQGRKMYENYTETMKYLEEHTGLNITSKAALELYLILDMERENGLQLPNWTKSVFPSVMLGLVHLEYQAKVATDEMKRLSSGFLLKKIIKDTRLKIRNVLPQKRKMFLYSAHEYNLTYLMQLLGIYYPHIPPFSSYILIEIHNFGGIRKVRVFYQDYSGEKPMELKLPNCERFCNFDKFAKLYKMYLPKSSKECDL